MIKIHNGIHAVQVQYEDDIKKGRPVHGIHDPVKNGTPQTVELLGSVRA